MGVAGGVGKEPCFVFIRDIKEEHFFKARNLNSLFESTRAEVFASTLTLRWSREAFLHSFGVLVQ